MYLYYVSILFIYYVTVVVCVSHTIIMKQCCACVLSNININKHILENSIIKARWLLFKLTTYK